MAVAGTDQLDVTTIDPSTVTLVGVSPLRFAYEDVATPIEPFLGKESCSQCTEEGADGYLDLSLKFDRPAVIAAIEATQGPVADGEYLALPLEGQLFDGRSIAGEDVVVILKK